MNRLVLPSVLMLLASLFGGIIVITPTPPSGPGGLRINNVSATRANSPIRLWILTEAQIAKPPTTKSEAERLESYVIPLFRTFTFNRKAGTYFLVASNEAYFQSLKDNDKFEPGVAFAVREFKVESRLIPVRVANTATPTRLPQITLP